ncbi:hypothetical protein [Helicobacter salomonis]|uniref:hypothetical protein n=1 Tax=Helicobacter salomonis TaxID=56878 RepID=UPI000CF09577|nr:hypothetical protein [Helicobacter salomonis]
MGSPFDWQCLILGVLVLAVAVRLRNACCKGNHSRLVFAFKNQKWDMSAASGLPLAFVALCYVIFEKNRWT